MAERWQRLLAAGDALLNRWRTTRVARRALVGFGDHQAPQVAGSMAYFAMLSLFQVVVLGIVAASLVIGEGDARRVVLGRLEAALPLQDGTIGAVVDSIVQSRGGLTAVSIVILAWGGLGFFDALSVGVGRAFATPTRRSFWHDKLIVLVLMVAVALLTMAALAVGVVAGVAAHYAEHLPGGVAGGQAVLDLVGLVLPIALVLFALLVIYRLVPNRPVRLRQVWPGALVATFLWTALRLSFTWYATSVAHYQSFFGPVSTAITLLVFLYLSSASVLLGAEIARSSVIEDERAADSGAGQMTPVV